MMSPGLLSPLLLLATLPWACQVAYAAEYVLPFPTMVISSDYGPRYIEEGETGSKFHYGIDYAIPGGTPIKAITAGALSGWAAVGAGFPKQYLVRIGDFRYFHLYYDGPDVIKVTDWTLTNGRKYTYRLDAVDKGGNRTSVQLDAIPQAGPEWGP